MKKFLVLYRMDMNEMRKMMEATSKEEREKGMAEWREWMKKNADIFADPGAPVGKNTQMKMGASAQVSNDIGGYSIVQAESAEAAVKALEGSPHFKMAGATCDLMEIVSMN